MEKSKKPIVLLILDGFGYQKQKDNNAITQETMPFFFSLLSRYPWTTLTASGKAVGLPPKTPGNSAVGHFTLGAGAMVEQPLTTFSRLIQDNQLCNTPAIKKHFTQLAQSRKALHILGLMSDGGSHSKLEFTQAIIACARSYGIKTIRVHAILDGRDAPQKSAAQFLQKIDAPIVTMQGRMYAMDRNENADRVNQGYRVLTQDNLSAPQTWQEALENYYSKGLYDETIPPTQLLKDATIAPGDGLVFVNIRADRSRELYRLLKDNKDLSFVITGINYTDNQEGDFICKVPQAENTLGDYLQEHHIRLFTIAESEKYAHVTYFFNGGRETKRPNETRVIIPSDNPVTFTQEPAMKAPEITDALVHAAQNNQADFYLANYANADMVGHSGDLVATQKAVTVLDNQLKKLYAVFVQELGGTLYITGDHGNAEDKHNHNPSHTTNPVYFVIVTEPPCDEKIVADMQTLADVKKVIIHNSFS